VLTAAWKGKAAAADEDADMDDLFDDSVAELPTGGGDRSARRADFIARIMNPTHGREEHRAGNLRKVVQLSDTPEELEELGRVIQQWRVNGYGVSKQTSTEIVGRCINLGRADLAEKYYRNRADCECRRAVESVAEEPFGVRWPGEQSGGVAPARAQRQEPFTWKSRQTSGGDVEGLPPEEEIAVRPHSS
jgi:hypothetical protein